MERKISKTDEMRTIELSNGLKVIRDSIQGLQEGKDHNLIPLSSQLRAFLLEKKSKPLLEYFYDLTGMPNDVYLGKQEEFYSINSKDIKFLKPNITLYQEEEDQTKATIKEILEMAAFSFKGQSVSIEKLIKIVADKMGGAHYDPDYPEEIDDLFEVSVFKSLPLKFILYTIGSIVSEVGIAMLSRMVNTESHFLFHFSSVNREGYLFDFKSPNTPMRCSVYFGPNRKINVKIISIDGVEYCYKSRKLLPLCKDNYFIFSISINDDAKTHLRFLINGESCIEKTVDEMLVLLNDPRYYERYFNRSEDDLGAGCNASLGLMASYNIIHDLAELSKTYVFFLERSQDPKVIVSFASGSYGYIPFGENDMQLIGGAAIAPVSEITFPERETAIKAVESPK